MDDRRPNTFQQTQVSRKKAGVSRATYGTMLMALLMGLLNLIAFAVGADILTNLTVYFSIFLFLLSSILISDFTAVLIDARDTMILLPKPVNDRTFLMARLLHIIVHMFRVIFPMLLPASVFLFSEYNWLVLVAFLMGALLASMFVIFLINAVYLLVIRVTTPARFKSFIAWFQVGFMILLYGAYQVVPRPGMVERFQTFTVMDYPLISIYPPYWFGASVVGIAGLMDGVTWWWIVVTTLMSGGSCWIVIRYLAPAFNQKLAMLSGGSDGSASTESSARLHPLRKSDKSVPVGYAHRLANWFTRSALEKASFLFSWKWALRNRGFRMRVYPAIGYIVVWFAVSIYRNVFQISDVSADRAPAIGILGLIYLSCFVFISAIQQISIGDDYKASWIFFSSPVAAPGPIILGSLKALLSQFFLPLAVVLVFMGIWWQGIGVLPNLLLGFSNQLLISAILLLLNYRKLPASLPPNQASGSGGFMRGIVMLLFNGIFGLAHYFIYSLPVVVFISAILSLLAVWLLLLRIERIAWKELSVR